MAIFNSFLYVYQRVTKAAPGPSHPTCSATPPSTTVPWAPSSCAQRSAAPTLCAKRTWCNRTTLGLGTCRENPMLIEILWRLYGVLRKLYDIIWDCIGFSREFTGSKWIFADFTGLQSPWNRLPSGIFLPRPTPAAVPPPLWKSARVPRPARGASIHETIGRASSPNAAWKPHCFFG